MGVGYEMTMTEKRVYEVRGNKQNGKEEVKGERKKSNKIRK